MTDTNDRAAKAEALLLHFTAEAHRRKWAYDQGVDDDGVPIKSEAFDALHRLGEEMRVELEKLRRVVAKKPEPAAVLPPVDRGAVLWEAADDLATAFGDPMVKHIGALGASHLRRRAREIEAGQAGETRPETPLEKRLRYSERRNDELRTECKRRGKTVLEQSEKICALEREIDGIQRQLGAEILRADEAEAELRRMADEAQQQECAQCSSTGACNGGPCPLLDEAEAQQDAPVPVPSGWSSVRELLTHAIDATWIRSQGIDSAEALLAAYDREHTGRAAKTQQQPDTETPTVQDVAHALDNSTPYPIELHVDLCRFMAERLLEMLTIRKRPEHAVWQPDEEPAADQPAPMDPAQPAGPATADDEAQAAVVSQPGKET